MTRIKADTLRSIADEPILVAEASPAARAPAAEDHPALDPGPAVTATATQNARQMNAPADATGVLYSGEQLAVTPAPPVTPQPAFSGAGLLTTAQEAALRTHSAENNEAPRET